jgi:hypothetical protein
MGAKTRPMIARDFIPRGLAQLRRFDRQCFAANGTVTTLPAGYRREIVGKQRYRNHNRPPEGEPPK